MHEYLGHTLSSRFPSSLDGLCSGSPRFSLRHFTRMAFLLAPGLLPSNAPSTRSPALPNRPIPFCRFSCSEIRLCSLPRPGEQVRICAGHTWPLVSWCVAPSRAFPPAPPPSSRLLSPPRGAAPFLRPSGSAHGSPHPSPPGKVFPTLQVSFLTPPSV